MTGLPAILAICVVLLPGVSSAQQSTAASPPEIRISGRVVDPVNMPLSEATVSLTSVGSETAKRVQANESGAFTFESVPPGAYVLRFDTPGFLSRIVRLTEAETEHDVNLGSVMLHIGEVTEGPLRPAKRPKKVEPVTVCESLAGLEKFGGKLIAIVGRMECGASLIGNTCFLVEDRCEQPVRTNGYAWPNKVVIVNYWEEGMPRPPSSTPEIDHAALSRKLALVSRSTALGWHKEARFKIEGQGITFSHFEDVKDHWGIAYGLFFTAPKLQNDGCGDEIGYGGFNGAPAALITLPYALRPVGTENTPKR